MSGETAQPTSDTQFIPIQSSLSPVCITGMHRSGTSMITRMLNLCGLYLGPESELLPPKPDNPEGFWELEEINFINNDLLEHFGGAWDQPPVGLPSDFANLAELTPLRQRAAKVLARFIGHEPWGWKDPRSSLTLKFWQELTEGLRVVICLRNPLDAAGSLTSRGTPVRFGYHLWSVYYRELLRQVKNQPFIITHYDSFFYDGAAELRRLVNFLGLEVSESEINEACAFTKKQLRKHSSTDFDLIRSEIPLDIVEQYLELSEQAGPIYQQLRLNTANDSLLLPLPLSESAKTNILHTRLDYAWTTLKATRAEHDELQTQRDELQLNTENLTHQLEVKDQHISGLDGYIEKFKQHIQILEQNVQTLERKLKNRNQQTRNLEEQVYRVATERQLLTDKLHNLEENQEEMLAYVRQLEQDRKVLLERIGRAENDLYALQATRTVRAARAMGLVKQQLQQGLAVTSNSVAAPIIKRLKGTLECNLDNPTSDSEINGVLEVTGWAVSWAAPIKQVEILVNGILLGTAQYGLPRPDVLHQQPWLPVGCGFEGRFVFTPEAFGLGFKQLQVRFTDTKGHYHEISRNIRIGPASEISLKDPEKVVHLTPLSYEAWISENEPGASELNQQAEAASSLAYQPLISLITPVYNPPPQVLSATVQSVLSQTYDNWELCLVDGASTDPEIQELLVEITRTDPRIRLRSLEQNLGIVGNSNSALEMAQGEFCALLDHDDTLAPNALYEVAKALNIDNTHDFIYSDFDLLSEDGMRRFDPLFKPDWSPEIMLSANYLTHLTVIRTAVIHEVGGFTANTDGAQDWDLFLRILEKPRQVKHIPKILYHWRTSANSTAANIANKPTVPTTQLRVIEEHLARVGLEARAFFESGYIRVKWPLKYWPKVSIIIPTKDHLELIAPCLQSVLEKTIYPNFEVIVVDTGSTAPQVLAYYQTQANNPKIRLLEYTLPFNFSAVNNWAVSHASGEMLLFLNNDTEVISPDWLEEMVRWGQRPEIGIVGAKLLKRDGTIQHAGVVVGLGGFAGHIFAGLTEGSATIFGQTEWYRNYSAVTAACMLVRREVFVELDGFEENFKLNGSDVELSLRAQSLGYRIVYTPFARLYHLESATHQGKNIPPQDYILSQESYRPLLETGDPFYNPNLSYWSTVPELKRRDEQSSLEMVHNFVEQLSETTEVPVTNLGAVSNKASKHDQYSEEARLISSWLDFSKEELSQSLQVIQNHQESLEIRSITWFIPLFQHAFYGGIHTILRFAAYYAETKGVVNRFVVVGHASSHTVQTAIEQAFPQLQKVKVEVISTYQEIKKLEPSDIAIASLWSTAYYLLRFNQTKRKFYFIQDYEPLFYPAGSISAQVEASYRFGFYGITNTISLKQIYEEYYGGQAAAFVPAVDTKVFHPGPRLQVDTHQEPYTIFFYGRPGHQRNGFELGATALRKLKERMGDQVRIFTAGAVWEPRDYGLSGVVENLGLLKYEETAALYRTCDLGLVMMFTRHPSYLPLELMASGCLVVTNENTATRWFLHNGENCLLSAVSATSLADTIEHGLVDLKLRKQITTQALELIKTHYADWQNQMELIFQFMGNPKSIKAREDTELQEPIADKSPNLEELMKDHFPSEEAVVIATGQNGHNRTEFDSKPEQLNGNDNGHLI